MLDAPTQQQKQLWVVQRLQRICSTFRDHALEEPCLEQYEQRVQQITDSEVTEAAAAWIRLIVQSLRQNSEFVAEDYIR